MDTKLLDQYITQNILKPQYRNYNIEGAPYKIGDKIIVYNNPSNDNTFDSEFIGKVGTVLFLEYDCGCGQSFPYDPMIGVKFIKGEVAEFWKEEVGLVI